jgi:hypothetical protein
MFSGNGQSLAEFPGLAAEPAVFMSLENSLHDVASLWSQEHSNSTCHDIFRTNEQVYRLTPSPPSQLLGRFTLTTFCYVVNFADFSERVCPDDYPVSSSSLASGCRVVPRYQQTEHVRRIHNTR